MIAGKILTPTLFSSSRPERYASIPFAWVSFLLSSAAVPWHSSLLTFVSCDDKGFAFCVFFPELSKAEALISMTMLTFTDYLLCAKHRAKHFTCIASFNSEVANTIMPILSVKKQAWKQAICQGYLASSGGLGFTVGV